MDCTWRTWGSCWSTTRSGYSTAIWTATCTVCSTSTLRAEDKLKAAEDKLKATEERLKETRTALGKERKETRCFKVHFKVAHYWQRTHSLRLDDLATILLARDGRITELEEENEELRKANDDLLLDDEDPMEDMDVDPESD